MVTAKGRQLEIKNDEWVFSDTGEKADPITLIVIDIESAITAAGELRRKDAVSTKDVRAFSLAITHLEDALFRISTIC